MTWNGRTKDEIRQVVQTINSMKVSTLREKASEIEAVLPLASGTVFYAHNVRHEIKRQLQEWAESFMVDDDYKNERGYDFWMEMSEMVREK